MENGKSSPLQYKTASKSHRAFVQMLRRQRKKNSKDDVGGEQMGRLASFYLDCFLIFDKKICADTVVEAGLCESGEFTAWRSEQRRLGNLDWSTTKLDKSDAIRYEYRPGAKIAKYIDQVASDHALNASKGYVDKRLDEFKKEIRMTLKAFIEKIDPPADDEKVDLFLDQPAKYGEILSRTKRAKKSKGDEEDALRIVQ